MTFVSGDMRISGSKSLVLYRSVHYLYGLKFFRDYGGVDYGIAGGLRGLRATGRALV